MIRIQEVKRENRFGTEHRGWVPIDTQQLSKAFEKSVFGALAETDANGVVAGKIDYEHLLNF